MIVAIVVPEIPRVVRLVRSVVLSIREEPYVEAAIAVGTRTPLVLVRHVLPNTIAPLIVQATYIAASAILIEAILSFLGVGIPPQTPTWGNIMAEGRAVFRIFPHNILFPGIFLALTVLAVNMLGDGLARRARSADEQAAVSAKAAPSANTRSAMSAKALRDTEREGDSNDRARPRRARSHDRAARRRRSRARGHRRQLHRQPRRNRLPRRRIRIRQERHRARDDGPAAGRSARDRRARSCSPARTCSRPPRRGCRRCAARGCRWSSRSR